MIIRFAKIFHIKKNMTLKERINAFSELGVRLTSWLNEKQAGNTSVLDKPISEAFIKNGWFTESQVLYALEEISLWLKKDPITT